MSSYENDHPTSNEPDAVEAGHSLDEILDELFETGGDGMVLIDSQGRRILGEGVVELMAGTMGRIKAGASESYITSLPSARSADVAKSGEDSCSICQTTFQILLDEEEHYLALDSPAIATENLGVVRIGTGCEHFFCRRDASRWLSKSNSCPLCRSVCDPSVSTTASSSSTPSTDPPQASIGEGETSQDQDPRQMMNVLQTLLFGGDLPPGFGGGRDQRPDERGDYSSMYS